MKRMDRHLEGPARLLPARRQVGVREQLAALFPHQTDPVALAASDEVEVLVLAQRPVTVGGTAQLEQLLQRGEVAWQLHRAKLHGGHGSESGRHRSAHAQVAAILTADWRS